MEVIHIEIAKLELQPGDILVVRVPPTWDAEQRKVAYRAVESAMRLADLSVPILMGSTDVEFQIVRKEAA